MSSNNGEGCAVIISFVLVGVFLYFVGIALYTMLAFLAFAMTVISLIASFVPIPITPRIVLWPEEARSFIIRGIVGACLLPAFLYCAALYLGFEPSLLVWKHNVVIGYILGSLGVVYIEARCDLSDEPPIIDVRPSLPPAPAPTPLPPPRKPQDFQFADWNDEEERR